LGAALQEYFGDGAKLTDGPPLTEDTSGGGGFFYELYLSNRRKVTDADFEALTKIAKKLIKSKARFDSVVVDKATAAKVFAGNPFKLALLDIIPPHDPITLYRCGDFVDLCRGPHVPHTGIIKVAVSMMVKLHLLRLLVRLQGFVVTKSSGSHLDARLGTHSSGVDTTGDGKVLLQRAYGIAFTSAEEQQSWEVWSRAVHFIHSGLLYFCVFRSCEPRLPWS
jgi:Threonyl and Alanyl tRNA synthetase second additional domain